MRNQAGFFVSCAIGLEDEVASEISEVWGELLESDGRPHCETLPELRVEKGGVELTCSFNLGLQLNYFLRLPHRVLYRVRSFRCRDFPKLFSEAKKINFVEIVGKLPLQLEIAASRSRLNHEGRIEKTLTEAWLIKPPAPSELGLRQTVYVRFYDDLCTISLDCSGEHLHFRGGGEFKGEAPLRETLANYCLRKMIGARALAELVGIKLVDPMVGSGTFLAEAAHFFQVSGQRDFSFLYWPRTPKIFKSPDWLKNYNLASQQPFQLYGYDIDVKMIQASAQNLQTKGIVADLEPQDLFLPNQRPKGLSESAETWLIVNPPYGERLAVEFSGEELLSQILHKFQPDRVGILFSRKQAKTLPHQVGKFVLSSSYPVLNGGIECDFQIWQKKS